jgi:hypothetical protein
MMNMLFFLIATEIFLYGTKFSCKFILSTVMNRHVNIDPALQN